MDQVIVIVLLATLFAICFGAVEIYIRLNDKKSVWLWTEIVSVALMLFFGSKKNLLDFIDKNVYQLRSNAKQSITKKTKRKTLLMAQRPLEYFVQSQKAKELPTQRDCLEKQQTKCFLFQIER